MTAPLTSLEALARYLEDPAHAGVYGIEASHAAGLDAETAGTVGLDWRGLASAPFWSREALLDGLAESLAFPDYFGRNWDAAWDCLTELEWETGRARVVVVPVAAADVAAMAAFLELMQDAAEHWASRGHALTTVILWEGEAPSWALELPALPLEAPGLSAAGAGLG